MFPGTRSIVLAALVVVSVVGCSRARDAVTTELETNRPGVLTVATSLASPGFWDGDTPDSVIGGYEWAIANEVAERFDLELEIVDIAFTDIVAGDLGEADLALAQLVPTDERRESLAFGVTYLDADFGVLVPDGESILDLATARQRSWVTLAGSQQQAALVDIVRPTEAITAVADEILAAAAVRSGLADAALIDLPSALVIAGADEALDVTAKVQTGDRLAPGFPLGSPNIELIDTALRALANDGTLQRLEETWLESLYERPARDVPTIVTKSTASN